MQSSNILDRAVAKEVGLYLLVLLESSGLFLMIGMKAEFLAKETSKYYKNN